MERACLGTEVGSITCLLTDLGLMEGNDELSVGPCAESSSYAYTQT